jgi:hypothetical protein
MKNVEIRTIFICELLLSWQSTLPDFKEDFPRLSSFSINPKRNKLQLT